MRHAAASSTPSSPLSLLNEVFVRALKALGDAGQTDLASRLAGEAWKELRDASPDEAEKLNKALHWLNRPQRARPLGAARKVTDLEVRHLAPAQRHELILETCTALPLGDAIVLINDHDPKPLYYQFEAEFPGQFSFSYLESGPEVWRVEIARKQAA